MRDIIIRMKEDKNSKKTAELNPYNGHNTFNTINTYNVLNHSHWVNPDQYSLWNFIHSSAREKFHLSPNLNIDYTFSPNLLINRITDYELKRPTAFVCNINNFEQIFDNKRIKEEESSLPLRTKGFLNEYCMERTKPKKKLLSFSFQNSSGIKTSLNKARTKVIHSPTKIFKVEKNYVKYFLNKKRRAEIKNMKNDKDTHDKRYQGSSFIENIFELKNIKNESDNIKLESNNIKLESNDFKCLKLESPIVLKYDFFKENKTYSTKSGRQGMKYKMFPLDVKLMCLEMVKKIGDVKQISEIFQVPVKSLKRWLALGPERKKGCGRKVRDPLLEKKLLSWYNKRVEEKDYPSPNEVTRKALELSNDPKFLASKGWLEKFKNKFKIKLKTRLSQSNSCFSK